MNYSKYATIHASHIPDICYADGVCHPRVFFIGSEFLPVVESVRTSSHSIDTFVCVGDNVQADMINYQTVCTYDDNTAAIVAVDDEHDLAMM